MACMLYRIPTPLWISSEMIVSNAASTLSIDTLSLGSESGECGRWDSSRAPSPSWWPLLVVANGVEAKISRFLIVICASPDRCTSAVVMRTCRFIFARSLSKTLLRWKTAETFSVRSECSMSSSVYALNSRGLSEAERVGTSMSVALRSLVGLADPALARKVGLADPATQSFQLDPVLVRLTDALSSISNLHPVL